MAYNTLSVMGSPYYINNNINYKKKNVQVEEPEENAQSSEKSAETTDSDVGGNVSQAPKKNIYQQLAESKAAHQKAIESRDEHLKNATVNIAQVLKDFKNTGLAIGTPQEVMDEVDAYVELIKKQLAKEQPDSQLIRSNLKNAASLLDKYISETLQKTSKVVTNWVDAIFLQQIDLNYNEEVINPNFAVKFPQNTQSDSDNNIEKEISPQEDEKKSFIPQDDQLKKLFVKAKRYSYAKNYKVAMETFKEALDRAIEVNDKETESKVLFEIGNIYDKNDYLAQALTSYNRSIKMAEDLNVKSKAHYSMAQIYDDVAQFESAINHYMSSISYAGESENLLAQSTSLVKIGNIYADTYKSDAFEFFSVAEDLVNETQNHKVKGYVCSNIANAHNKFNKPKEALKYYSSAVLEYDEAETPKNVAINYKRAAELMIDYDNTNKAKKLLQKALLKARQTEDVQLMNEIHKTLQNA